MRVSLRSIHRWAPVLACAFAALVMVGLIAFALLGHPMPLGSTAENDRFLERAESLLAGHLPRDEHRPLLYVLLVGGLGWLTGGDCFLAGRLVSAFAGGGVVLATFFLGRSVADRSTGLLAALLVGAHAALWENCVQVTTDGVFTLLFVLTILAAVHVARRGTLRGALLCGLSLALAYFTRYTAIVLVPVLVIALPVGAASGRRLAALGLFTAALAAGLVPHCALTWHVFGRPFYDETWRSLAFRHFGHGDWAFLDTNPFDGTWSVLSHDPMTVLKNALAGLWNYLTNELSWQLAAGDGAGSQWFVLCLAAGLALAWQRRPAAAMVLALACLLYVLVVSVTFFTWERIMLPVLPPFMVMVAWSLVHLPAMPLRRRGFEEARVLLSLAAGILGVGFVASHLPGRLLTFVRAHPLREVEVAQELAKQDGEGIVLLSSYVSMGRQVPCRSLWPTNGGDAAATYAGVLNILAKEPADYLLVGPKTIGPAVFEELRKAPVPGHLQLLRDEPEVRLYRVAMPSIERLATGGLAVRPTGGRAFDLSLELRDDAPPDLAASVGVQGPDGIGVVIPLGTAVGRLRSGSVSLPGDAPGRWRLFPRILDPGGTLYAGEELAVEVPPAVNHVGHASERLR